MDRPPDTMVEEKEELMVSPTGGDPFHKIAHFLKPIVPSTVFKFPNESFSSLPPHFGPRECPLEVEFPGWRIQLQEDWTAWVGRLASLHQSTWKKAGIYEAIFNSTYQIRRNTELIYGLAEKWCSETNSFIFAWGEATITLEDLMVMGGYSVLGESIFNPLENRELKELEEKLNEVRTEINRGASRRPSASLWLKKFKNNGSELEHEAFLVMWLCRYVFPGTYNTIQKGVFSIAIHLARGTRVALAPAILASIYKDLSLLNSAIVDSSKLETGCDGVMKVSIKSPFQFVQLWAWERFVELSPSPGVINLGQPRLARWDKVNGVEVENLRRVLDSAGDGFKWRPYALTTENWQLPKYYPEEEMHVSDCSGLDDELHSFFRCLRASELSGFGTIEQYLPHRVAMQFGFDQDIPCVVARSNPSSDIAWSHYIKKFGNASLYVPSRFLKADISTRYLKWWKESMLGLKKTITPKVKKSKCIGGSQMRAKPSPVHPGSAPKKAVEGSKKWKKNHDFILPPVSNLKDSENLELLSKGNEGNDSLFPPGFPRKCSRMEAEGSMDEDGLTLSELMKYNKFGRVNMRTCGDSEKLPCQVQNLASSSSVHTMKSERFEAGGPMDEAQIIKCHSKQKNVETRTCCDSEKLSSRVQNLSFSIAASSADIMKSKRSGTEDVLNDVLIEGSKADRNLKNVIGSTARSSDVASIVDKECASNSSLNEKRVSVLKDRVSRLEVIISVLKANYSGNKLEEKLMKQAPL
ncbi:uncharacterized protein LOC133734739 [Rosa rugosa]|uniref:uncharacterized protein LOC133734739 n=1 Tax=Rosa rugosa TaxID=74645 RepID=UPI002B4042CC|nr:uncharacterized protein LOC133734739 [Rosa rugosa]XP_062018343.1 uncharacterized protein LOC133734739 [Rosa rugosa]XP_062018344.1 uncharacterized protein LOC133734739 [Rosa rugosa]XP_062018345.1 uncharacterized protein LOC133734739 [Rosa rugosa]